MLCDFLMLRLSNLGLIALPFQAMSWWMLWFATFFPEVTCRREWSTPRSSPPSSPGRVSKHLLGLFSWSVQECMGLGQELSDVMLTDGNFQPQFPHYPCINRSIEMFCYTISFLSLQDCETGWSSCRDEITCKAELENAPSSLLDPFQSFPTNFIP